MAAVIGVALLAVVAVFGAPGLGAQRGGEPPGDAIPLLASHRWLCAAELFAFERKVPEAADARRKYGAALATARKSTSLLVRTAAERLAVRATCFATR